MPPAFRLTPRGSDASVDVVALGENSLDLVGQISAWPRPGSKAALTGMAVQVGGQSATAAVGCARLGLRTAYIGAFGDDDWGATVHRTLRERGVDVRPITRAGVPSRTALILVDETGDRTVLEHRHPQLEIEAGDLDPAVVISGRVLLVDATHPRAAIAAARLARAARIPTIVDVDRPGPGVDNLLGAVDLIVVPEAFILEWSGASSVGLAVGHMAAAFPGAAAIVATLGREGSLALVGGVEVRSRGYAVDVVDTTGAGDAFRAGFAAGWLRFGSDGTAGDVLAMANAVAALNCRGAGAQTGLPTLEEVDGLLTRGAGGRSN